MIHSLATDVEIFKNLFSATFVDLQDYLKVFKDCGEKALTECLTVAEIESRLDKVKSDIFYISDTDDSQLLSLVEYINSKEAHFENDVPVRYDVFGYNNQAYDDMMFKAFMMYFNRFDNTKQLITKLKEISDKIISLQDDKDAFWKDRELDLIRKYPLPWATVDLFKVYALNSAGVNVDKDSGERKKFGKSLKQVSINLKWHNLLDFKLPPIDDEEGDVYRKKDAYRGMTNEQLNHLITNDFDRYILPKYVEPMLHYNKNDVYLVCEIARQKPDEIKLRYSLGAAFNLNLLCAARSSIADKLLYKFYSERSGLSVDKFKDLHIFKYNTEINGGPGPSRQRGIEHATGEWITFIDQDDEFLPDVFSQIREKIEEFPEIKTMVNTPFYIINAKTKETTQYLPDADNWVHGKFYHLDNFIRKYNIHFCEDLYSHEDIYFSTLVKGELNCNELSYIQCNVPSYNWYTYGDSLSHKPTETGYNYLEEYS